MSEIKRFEDLKVWQKSHELVLEVYKITRQFPKEEKIGLISQNRKNVKWFDKITIKPKTRGGKGVGYGV